MITIENLYKQFGANQVLKGVNLEVEEGETIVIIGRSGCGKSILLKHIIGILDPDQGRVIVDGTDLATLQPQEMSQFRLKFGMLFQGAALFDSLNVAENVGFSLIEHSSMAEDEIQKKVQEKLGMVGLEGIERIMPSELSGGMKKRVGLARAICSDPKVILYDEPTTGLDPINADAINDLILEMQKKLKVTSIVVTHDMTSAYKVGDRIAMLYQGKIISIGTPDEIRNTSSAVVRQFISGSATGPITQEQNASSS